MEAKKVSFGFSKINKKANLLPTKENVKTVSKVELIKCLEGQEIKLVEEKPEEAPLTIPLKNSQKTSTALASLMKRRAVLLGEDEQEEENDILREVNTSKGYDRPEDIEKRAARELLAEVQKSNSSDPTNNLVLTVVKADELPLEGAKESTLDDYENIPIEDFGKALLRGMGWTEPLQKANKKGGPPTDDTPMVRPKGMGLGADKALSKKAILVAPEANEVLEIKRNAFVRILGGKYKDLYGQIEGFDEHKGRVIVKLAIGGAKEAFNEFLCQPVSRKEYTQYGKCINSSKYDEYKKKENECGQIILDKDSKDCKDKRERNIKDGLKQYKDYKRVSGYEHSKDEHKVKQETGSIKKEEIYRRQSDYESSTKNRKNYSKNIRYHNDDVEDYRKHYDERDQEYEVKKDEKHNSRDNRKEKNRNSKSCERSTHRDRNGQNRGERLQYKSDDSSDSESVTYHSSKLKKSKKSHSKKKSKKNKSKYKDSSTDNEITSTSTDTSSDDQEERIKKHKKKTKKSKKPRERSRSRGRR